MLGFLVESVFMQAPALLWVDVPYTLLNPLGQSTAHPPCASASVLPESRHHEVGAIYALSALGSELEIKMVLMNG